MASDARPAPIDYKGVTVSSAFTDLSEHRAALIRAIDGQQLKSVVMEHDSARPDGDVIDSSLRMVQDGSAYVGVISHKYGQVPECLKRNPEGLSLTQLELNEARRLGRPVLLFIMGEDHPVKRCDVETDPEKARKLGAFRENAKRLKPDSSVHRVYATFDSPEEFKEKASHSIAELRRHLDRQAAPATPQPQDAAPAPHPGKAEPDPIPTPPAFYAEPPAPLHVGAPLRGR